MEETKTDEELVKRRQKKVLIATHHLDVPAGTQTWVYTLAHSLRKKGHSVTLLTRRRGMVSGILEAQGFPVFSAFPTLLFGEPFDLTVCNHQTMLRWCRERKHTTGPIKCFVHGVLPKKEQPIPGADSYIAISEEVADHVKRCGFRVDAILPNFVDLERFSPISYPNDEIRNVFYLSNHQGVRNTINNVCKRRGLNFVSSSSLSKTTMFIEKELADADVVFSLGRGVYETMASGRAPFVADHSGIIKKTLSDGILTKELFHESIRFNCNGKRFSHNLTERFIEEQFDSVYNKDIGLEMRELAVKYLDVDKAADCILGGI